MKRKGEGNYELFACNEEAVKLFSFRDKQEFMERYFETYPEYQPNGKKSIEEGLRLFEEAYTKGRCVTDFMFQTVKGEPIPAEVTLVRVKYGKEYVIAGYTRDMREHRRMMDAIANRDKLLNAGNLAVQALLKTVDELDIGKALIESLEIVGRAVDADRVQIWHNEMIDGSLHFVLNYEWLSAVGHEKTPVPIGLKFSYDEKPEWKNLFMQGEYLNGPLSEMNEDDRAFLDAYDIKTIVIIPLFLKDDFWGFFSLDDCKYERTFNEDEIKIFRSVSQMIVSAQYRSVQAAEIREAHGRVRVLLDKMPFACHLWNSNLEIIDCNEEALRLFRIWDKQEYLTHIDDLSPEYQPNGLNSNEMRIDYIEEAFTKGKCSFEWVFQTRDGELIPTDITLVRVAYEDGFAVAAYIRDLREYQRMMEEIKQKSNLLNTINKSAYILFQSEIDEFEDSILLCMSMIGEAVEADRVSVWKNSFKDGQLCCTQVNEWVADERFRSSSTLVTDLSYEESIPTWLRLLEQGECVNALTSELLPVERARMEASGIKSVFAAPVFVHGDFWGFVGCDNCHSESVFDEDVASALNSGSLLVAYAQLRNEMTQNLQRAASELEIALKDTQRANSAKSDFLANMSHEMRTPLNAIIGLSGLSLESNKLDKEARLNLKKIYSSGDMLLNIVNDILDISKIEAGKMELVEVDYDVPSLINDTVTQNILRIGEKPIELRLDIGDTVFTRLYGDDLRVKQIMNNLLSNAIKYTEKGVVELGIHCEREGDIVWVTIRISDTGKGIRQEDMEKLFKDYSQLDLESNRKTEGTGLGLPISKSLAAMMDGTIDVESEYGVGSVFTVRIAQGFVTDTPLGKEVVHSLKNFRYSDDKFGRNTKIKRISLPYARVLVVDDNLTNLDVSRGLMKPYGMRIDCLTDGQQAVDAIREEKVHYNAVFMDHMMPGMDGIEATRIIREEIGSDYAKNVPIIALTANSIAGNEQMFLSKGFQAFIPKPIDIDRLDKVIKRFIRDRAWDHEDSDISDEDETTSQTALSDIAIPGLDILCGMRRFGDNEETYLDILRSYSDNTPPLLRQIETVTPDDLPDYAVIVHGIKGASHGICADAVGDFAEELEKAAKAGSYSFVVNNNAGFIEVVSELIADIKNQILCLTIGDAKPVKGKPDAKVLKALLDACGSLNTDEIDSLVKDLDAYEYESESDQISRIVRNAKQFDYSGITRIISELLDKEDN
ncbi:MAG: ATP-binding protein [Coriobacteriia bacterium]|nr:ATP-binding protein [Coriobacteriia bacterium]